MASEANRVLNLECQEAGITLCHVWPLFLVKKKEEGRDDSEAGENKFILGSSEAERQ